MIWVCLWLVRGVVVRFFVGVNGNYGMVNTLWVIVIGGYCRIFGVSFKDFCGCSSVFLE